MNKEPTARDLMSRPVKRLNENTTLQEAASFLLRNGISGALVVNEHGEPSGVFTFRDLAEHVQQELLQLPKLDPAMEHARGTGERIPMKKGFHFEALHEGTVEEHMTPGIVAVGPETPVGEIASRMAEKRIHRVFVKEGKEIIGVITTMDILRRVAKARNP